MSDEHSSHTAYDELSTTAEMHADCEAVQTNMPALRVLRALPVPAAVTAPVAFVGGAVQRVAAAPVLVISEATARLAHKLNPLD